MEEKQVQKPHKLVVNNRKTSMVTGVLDVLSFDLNEILLETEQGMLMVKGKDLQGKWIYPDISTALRTRMSIKMPVKARISL